MLLQLKSPPERFTFKLHTHSLSLTVLPSVCSLKCTHICIFMYKNVSIPIKLAPAVFSSHRESRGCSEPSDSRGALLIFF